VCEVRRDVRIDEGAATMRVRGQDNEMPGVREYCEQYPVAIVLVPPDEERPPYGPSPAEGPRWCVRALNEGGHNSTEIDLLDLIRWLRENRPELLA
jgi:hypothetical protein